MSFSPVVIDTNVILAANGSHEGLSDICMAACASRLNEIMTNGAVVIDDTFITLLEYQKRSNHKGGKSVGDVFLKWLFNHLGNSKRCIQVHLTSTAAHTFEEFPCAALFVLFDPPDRKFVAISNAHPDKPNILQASDCKWLDWCTRLLELGISVDFICPDDICKFYSAKFPDNKIPRFQ